MSPWLRPGFYWGCRLDDETLHQIIGSLAELPAQLPASWAWSVAGVASLLLILSLFARRRRMRVHEVRQSGVIDTREAARHILSADKARTELRDEKPAFKAKRGVVAARLKGIEPGSRILWIDDHPEHNAAEVAALELSGATVLSVRTNATALNILSDNYFDLVISDIGRDEPFGPSGLHLFTQMVRRRSISALPPMIFYSSNDLLDVAKPTDQAEVFSIRALIEDDTSTIEPFMDVDEMMGSFTVPATNRPAVLVDLVAYGLSAAKQSDGSRISEWYKERR